MGSYIHCNRPVITTPSPKKKIKQARLSLKKVSLSMLIFTFCNNIIFHWVSTCVAKSEELVHDYETKPH